MFCLFLMEIIEYHLWDIISPLCVQKPFTPTGCRHKGGTDLKDSGLNLLPQIFVCVLAVHCILFR